MRIDFRDPLQYTGLDGDRNAPVFLSRPSLAFDLGARLCYDMLRDEDLTTRREVGSYDIHQLREQLCAVLLLEFRAAEEGRRPPGWVNDNPNDHGVEDTELTGMLAPVPINVDLGDGDCEFLARWILSRTDVDGNLRFELQTALSSMHQWHRLAAFDVRPSRSPREYGSMYESALRDCRWAYFASMLERTREWCQGHKFDPEGGVLKFLAVVSRLGNAEELMTICASLRAMSLSIEQVSHALD
jgi:hypothetical protein